MATCSIQQSVAQFFLNQIWATFICIPCIQSMTVQLQRDLSNLNWCVFFPLPPQLQHCLPVYLLLSRAHSQSSGGTQHHEPPPAAHHKLSGPAPPGCPGALFPRTEGCTQEPFWQGEAAPNSPTHPSLPSKLSLYSSWPRAAAIPPLLFLDLSPDIVR